MLSSKRLTQAAGIVVLAVTLGGVVLEARTRKGDKLLAQSRAAEAKNGVEIAVLRPDDDDMASAGRVA